MATASFPATSTNSALESASDTKSQSTSWVDLKIELLTILTIILLLLHAPGIWYTRTPLIALLICGLIRRELTRLPVFWFVTAGLMAADVMYGWYHLDNHKFVEFYWCLVLYCAIATPVHDRLKVLTRNSQFILAAVMLFAVAWKAISVSYMSGEFFEYTLLSDERFANMAHWFGGVSYETLYDNRVALDWLKRGHLKGGEISSVTLASSGGVHNLAWAMTWWTILIEGLIGVLFLLPAWKSIPAIRDYSLLIFAVSTYLFAPVVAFGWLLMIMGAAQAQTRFRMNLFATVFVLIQIYTLPYADFVNSLLK